MMKNIKILMILLEMFVLTMLISCIRKSLPITTINNFCESMKSFDEVEMSKYTFASVAKFDLSGINAYVSGIDADLKKYAKLMTYTIVEEKDGENSNEKIYTIKFRYVDLSNAFKKAIEIQFMDELLNAYKKEEAEDEIVKSKKFCEDFENAMPSDGNEKYVVKYTDVICKNEKNEWKVYTVNRNEILDVLYCGMISVISNIKDIFKNN